LNSDAHLDVRPSHKSLNSGTPFFRLLEEFSDRVQLIEIGLQPQCNSRHHIQWARERGAHLFFLNEILQGATGTDSGAGIRADAGAVAGAGLGSLLSHDVFKKLAAKTPVYVSFDIDCLTSTEAPGCSQSWPTGLRLQDCLSFLRELQRRFSVKGLGIYEVSPPLDIAFQTSKAAAILTYHTLFQDVL
jgi:formiminoglutamase